ncbi:MAG: MutS protein msh5 [Piccolia ochrophora]|nr:MAG: MutS protein msh5 [Piccolia ochrophora]
MFDLGFLRANQSLAFAHMEVQVNRESDDANDQVTYLYNLRPGRSTASYGTICAALNGIDPAVVLRAQQLVLMSARGEDLVAACAIDNEDAQTLEQAENVARLFLATDFNETERDGSSIRDASSLLHSILEQ